MKILVVIPDSKMGGITTAAVNFCNLLVEKGHDVDVLNMAGAEDKKTSRFDNKVNILYLDKKRQYWNVTIAKVRIKKGLVDKLKCFAIGLRKKILTKKGKWLSTIFNNYKLNNQEYDVAIAYRQCAPCYYFVLNNVNAKKKIAFVHGELRYMGVISSWKKYMPKFDRIAYVSNSVQKEFVTKYPELNNNACTIYNMFDVEKIKSLALEVNPLTFDKSIKNIVTVARIDNAFKRIDWIPKICAEIIKKTKQPFHWYIVGDGPDFDEVKSLINTCGVNDYVTMVGATNNPYVILKDADFSVLLSKSEAYPMTIIESFILGVPIVVSRFASVEEMMQNGKHGLIAESSMESLLEAILQFLAEEEALERCKGFLMNIRYTNDKQYKQFIEAIGEKNVFSNNVRL